MKRSDQIRQCNLVLLVLDTVRIDHLSYFGYDRPTSSVLDELARNGLAFHQAIAPACWTLPVHASWFTGLYPRQHGAVQASPFLNFKFSTLAEVLSNAGYFTAGLSTNPFVSRNTGLDRGFHVFKEYSEGDFRKEPFALIPRSLIRKVAEFKESHGFLKYETAAQKVIQDAVDLIAPVAQRSETPFFVFINCMDAHIPRRPPKAYVQRFVDEKYRHNRFADIELGPFLTGQVKYSAECLEAIVQFYDAAISYLDHEIGYLIDSLQKLGVLDDTLLVIVADHGEHLGEHGLLGHNLSLYDDLIRVPLILHCPHLIPQAQDIHIQVETKDLFYTLIHAAGLSRTTETCAGGENLLNTEVAKFTNSAANRFAFAEDHEPVLTRQVFERFDSSTNDIRIYNSLRCVRTRDYKYIWSESTEHEFYDLKQDPKEGRNIIHEAPEALIQAQDVLEHWHTSVTSSVLETQRQATVRQTEDDVVMERLRNLGYL